MCIPLNPGAQLVSNGANPRGAVLQVLTSAEEQVDAVGRRHIGVGHVAASPRSPPRPLELSSRGLSKTGGAEIARGERACARGADCGSPGGGAAPAPGQRGNPRPAESAPAARRGLQPRFAGSPEPRRPGGMEEASQVSVASVFVASTFWCMET